MDYTIEDLILISASNENVFASLIIHHRLPIECCVYLPGRNKEYRKLVVEHLRGSLREDQLIGCFTVEEKQALLKKGAAGNGKKSRAKVARGVGNDESL